MTDEYWKGLFRKYESMPDEEFKSILDEVSELPDIPLAQEIEERTKRNEISAEGGKNFDSIS